MGKSKRVSFGGSSGGKGDSYRKVDKEVYADNWDRIFGKKTEEKKEVKKEK